MRDLQEPILRGAVAADLAPLAQRLEGLPLFRAYRLGAPKLEVRWRAALDRRESLLVAVDGATPLGLCWFLGEGTFGAGAYLRTLALAPDAQGRGLGGRLLEGYEEACAGAPGGLFLLTSDFNEGAQRFYERHGYQRVGALPDFAAKGITELIYWKRARET